MTLANALGVDADPEVVHGLHCGRRAAARARARGRRGLAGAAWRATRCDIFLQVFGPGIALGIELGERLAGRAPEEDEIEPMSRVVLEMARSLPSTGYLTALAQLQLLARGTVAFFADYDLLLTPVLAARPLRDRGAARVRREPLEDLLPLRHVRSLHAALQRHGPAGDLGADRRR